MHNLDDLYNLLATKTLYDVGEAENAQRRREAEEYAMFDPVKCTRQKYELLAANGKDLVALCKTCGKGMRFLPKHTGERASCVHCGATIELFIETPPAVNKPTLPEGENEKGWKLGEELAPTVLPLIAKGQKELAACHVRDTVGISYTEALKLVERVETECRTMNPQAFKRLRKSH